MRLDFDPLAPGPLLDRRLFLSGIALGAAAWTVPGAFAQELIRTPAQTRGPFYPDRLPLDTDNDLIVVNTSITPALGTIVWLSGKVTDARGGAVRGATVEIWQVDNTGAYLHSRGSPKGKRDGNFQGFGRFITGANGEYLFRTIKPVPYPGRTPHIHVLVKAPGRPEFVTQCYIRGERGNEKDGVLRGIRDAKQRESVIVPFTRIPDSRTGEEAARFDIVLGFTPAM